MSGHHLAEAGVLGRRGNPLEVAPAQICSQARARVSTNVCVRDLDLADGRRFESPLHRDGIARRRAADVDGAALEAARRRKERIYPELLSDESKARLVALAAEVGRTVERGHPVPPPWPKHARCPFLWSCKVGLGLRGSAGGVPSSPALLDQRPVPQVCEIPSAHEVLRDDRFT